MMTPAYAEVMSTREINWGPLIFLVSTPIVALGLLAYYISTEGFIATDLIPFVFMYYATGLAITAGYHRFYAHKTHEAHPVIQFLYLAFGAASVENSVLNWASDHRYHHQFVDRDGDPYNINRGFFWAHMGWMFFRYPPNRPYNNVPDLKRDRLVMWQEKYYLLLILIFGLGIPTLIGAAFGRPWGGFLWGGLIRMLIVHQVTYMINSVAHYFGKKNYSTEGTARDNGALALITFGEGYHSFHHAFASDYRIGVAWHHYDPGKWLIRGLSYVGLTSKLKRVAPDYILEVKRSTLAVKLSDGLVS